jgi:AcrR family transcriptional regulator
MNNDYLDIGRTKQKFKTRHHIIKTAQTLLAEKESTSLEEVAENAGISRATIYRYFPSIDVLVGEVGLSLESKTPDELVTDVEEMSLTKALLHIQDYFNDHAITNETMLRKFLSVSLQFDSSIDTSSRGARRLLAADGVISEKGTSLDKKERENLARIMTVLSGIEPLIANRDVNGMTPVESKELLSWAIDKILKGMGLPSS